MILLRPACGLARFPLFGRFGYYTQPPGVPITLPTSRQASLAVFGCLGDYTPPTSVHAPDIETGEFHGLQLSRRLDTASCELSLLIAVLSSFHTFSSTMIRRVLAVSCRALINRQGRRKVEKTNTAGHRLIEEL